MFTKSTFLAGLFGAASAGTTLWDGRFNDMTSSADLEKWSFSNPVGAYQYYIHGSGPVTDYVNLSADFKNPADSASKQGVKITIDDTAKWNSDMWRTELIPQTTAAINKGKVFYHFSVKTTADNFPVSTNEHQVAFFESHFTELKYGGASGTNLEWMVGGVSKWSAELTADEWHNVAYEIDFDAGSVSFHHSTGAAALTKTAGPFTASTSSNGADWHLGVLRLPQGGSSTAAEDWFFSGVYVESGELTTAVGTGSGAAAPAPAKPAASSPAAVADAPKASSTKPAPVAQSSPAAAVVSSAAPAVETPVAVQPTPTPTTTPTPAAPVVEAPASSSAAAVPVESPAPAPAPAPVSSSTPATGGNANAQLPEEFTIREFVAWLKARTGKE